MSITFYINREELFRLHMMKKVGKRFVTYFLKFDERIFPVGRLDYDTSGVIIMTNDGDFSYLMTHPKFEIEKKYVAKVKGIPDREALTKTRDVELF